MAEHPEVRGRWAMLQRGKCGDCAAWTRVSPGRGIPNYWGDCRRFPPQVVGVSHEGEVNAWDCVWPQVQETDGCWSFIPKEADENG